MKKIFLFLASMCFFVACDPVSEDIDDGGLITDISKEELQELRAEHQKELKEQSTVDVNGNVITCSTKASANAVWNIGGKSFLNNYAKKKMRLGNHSVMLIGLSDNGLLDTVSWEVEVTTITDPLTKYYIYGDPEKDEAPFKPAGWDAAAMRFSANEGKFTDINGKEGCSLPFLTDEVYFGKKTLIFDLSEVSDDCAGRIMNGWWSARYDGDQDVHWTNGLWELPITDAIANDCAQGGEGKDLDIMVTSGSMQVNAIYYEE